MGEKKKRFSLSRGRCSAVLTSLPGGRADQTDRWAPRHCKQTQHSLLEANTVNPAGRVLLVFVCAHINSSIGLNLSSLAQIISYFDYLLAEKNRHPFW